ncbi:MAG: hypothetical protein K8I30_21560, partial [Anaerolineae bacterium]|nr:hypothetical protein [Anaerolineae bacterium]
RLDAGIDPAAVSLIRTSDGSGADDLVLVLDGGNEQVRIVDYFDTTQDRRVEKISFSNAVTWTTADIDAHILDQAGTPNAMTGTAGNDVFSVDHPQDSVAEQAGQGTDLIISNISYALPGNVENLTLTGSLNIDATGNDVDNVIRGNSGNNRLDAGSKGNDQLIGGRGDDTYVINASSSTNWAEITELADEGRDTVLATAYFNNPAYTLPDNVENLVYDNRSYNAGVPAVTGNALDNVITVTNGLSDRGEFIIDGGLGADTLIGGGTSDTYILDNPGDRIIETGDSNSIDTVKANFDYVLGENLENLVLTGTAAIQGTGNALDNLLDGSKNAAANVLSGGQGNDIYIVDANDTVVELAGEGSDTVVIASGAAGATYSLAGYANVENLSLDDLLGASNLLGGEAGEILTGNRSANLIQGGGGDDTLYDEAPASYHYSSGVTDVLEGGAGNDRLISFEGRDVLDGGAGNDYLQSDQGTYRFSGAFDVDTVVCNSGYSQAVFTDLTFQDVQLERIGNDLLIRGPAGSGTVTVQNHFLTGLQGISFADDVYLSNAQIAIRAAQGNAITEGDDVVLGT